MASQDAQKYTSKLRSTSCLVIGGSSGIGYGVAEALVEHGAVVAIASSNASRVANAVSRIQAAYPSKAGNIHGLTVDLGTRDALDANLAKLFGDAVARIGTERDSSGKKLLDHVLYTAGDSLSMMPIASLSMDKILHAGTVRFFAPLLAAKHVATSVHPSHTSSYTVTTGAICERPRPDWSVIASFAGALLSMTRNLALDLAPIRVNCLNPGAVDTDLWGLEEGSEKKAQVMAEYGKATFTGRVGRVEDVVESFLGVVKDGNATASVVRTDGGGVLV